MVEQLLCTTIETQHIQTKYFMAFIIYMDNESCKGISYEETHKNPVPKPLIQTTVLLKN